MRAKTFVFLLGAGAAMPSIARAAKRAIPHAAAGAIAGYETVCEEFENSKLFVSTSLKRLRRRFKRLHRT